MVPDYPCVALGQGGMGRGARDVLLLLLTITSVGVSERRYPAKNPMAQCNVLALPRRMPPNRRAPALMRLAGGSIDDDDRMEEEEGEESDEKPLSAEVDFDKLLQEYEQKVEALRKRGSQATAVKAGGGGGNTSQAEAGESGGGISELEEELQGRLEKQLKEPRRGAGHSTMLSSLLLSSLELCDTQVYEPEIRALLGFTFLRSSCSDIENCTEQCNSQYKNSRRYLREFSQFDNSAGILSV